MLRPSLRTRTTRTLLVAATLVACLPAMAQCPATPHPKPGTALLVEESGQISVMRGNAVALFEGNIIQRQETIITGHEGYGKFEVSDGSCFEVYSDSQVVFHDNPTVTYKDLLNVFIGRVKVFIQHLNGPNYNSVTTPTAVISVRGTIFDVVVEDDEGTTLVSVEDGAVAVRNLAAGGEIPLLKPGDSIRISRHQPLYGRTVNRDRAVRAALDAATDAARIALGHGGGIGVPGIGGAGGGTGAQGDKGKNTGGSGTGSSTGGSGPPAGPKPGGGN